MNGARTRTTGLVALWRVALAGALLCGIGLLPWLSRTDPARTVLKARAADRDPSPELLESLRSQLGLDAGPFRLLGRWLAGLPHGDAGTSWISVEVDRVVPGVLAQHLHRA
ncbi:hypothetical protein ACWEWX_49525, partial [Streptomyces asiaticus]